MKIPKSLRGAAAVLAVYGTSGFAASCTPPQNQRVVPPRYTVQDYCGSLPDWVPLRLGESEHDIKDMRVDAIRDTFNANVILFFDPSCEPARALALDRELNFGYEGQPMPSSMQKAATRAYKARTNDELRAAGRELDELIWSFYADGRKRF